MGAPLLSVCLITYNHAKYIRQAIESVLMQQVDFSWELIVADDCSTDGTREILLEFRNQNPGLIQLILQDKNVGPAKNFNDLITAPKGKYIAYLECDDYWIDKNKLSKQVSFLEKNLDFSLCHHAYEIRQEGGLIISNKRNNLNQNNKIISFEDILVFPYPKSLTVLFRSKDLLKYDLDFFLLDSMVGDVPMWHLILLNGKGYYIEEAMGCYRINPQGVTNALVDSNALLSSKILILEKIIKKRMYNNNSLLREYLAKHYIALFIKERRFGYFIKSLGNKLRSKYLIKSPQIKNRVSYLGLSLTLFRVMVARFAFSKLKTD